MVLEVSVNKVFIPEWNGNKQENQPIEIHHRVPTMALFNKLIPKPSIRLTIDKDGNSDGGETEINVDYTKVVRDMVTEIRNFSINTDGKEVPIKLASDLFGENAPPVVSGLVDEVGQYLTALLQKKVVDPKN